MNRKIPLYMLYGVGDCRIISSHPFATPDMLELNLTRFLKESCGDVVMIIHRLTTSTDMFIKQNGRWQVVASHGSPVLKQ